MFNVFLEDEKAWRGDLKGKNKDRQPCILQRKLPHPQSKPLSMFSAIWNDSEIMRVISLKPNGTQSTGNFNYDVKEII